MVWRAGKQQVRAARKSTGRRRKCKARVRCVCVAWRARACSAAKARRGVRARCSAQRCSAKKRGELLFAWIFTVTLLFRRHAAVAFITDLLEML